MSAKCPICKTDVNEPQHSVRDGIPCDWYECSRCGDFWITINALSLNPLDNQEKIAVLSHWVRTKHENNTRGKNDDVIFLDRDLVKSIIKNLPPRPSEQADKFVLWLGNTKYPPGEYISVEPATHQSIMGAITPDGFGLVLYHLMNTGILKGHDTSDMKTRPRAKVTLSLEGWSYYEELKKGASESRKAFMAMDYSNKTLEKIVNEFFRDAVKSTGFVLFRLDDDRLRVEIQTSRFLIADLTDDNSGAYWEAGYAEGLGKPVICTCEKSKFEKDSTHFDTNHHLTIKWDETNPKEAAKQLKATIRATLPDAAKLTDD
jgi:hypothetical protein